MSYLVIVVHTVLAALCSLLLLVMFSSVPMIELVIILVTNKLILSINNQYNLSNILIIVHVKLVFIKKHIAIKYLLNGSKVSLFFLVHCILNIYH